MDGLYDKSFDFKAFFKIMRILKDIKPDIVHTHASLIVRIVARIVLRCKIIYTKHCYYELKKYESNWLRRKIYGLFDRMFSDKIIIVTEALRNLMIRRGVDNNRMVTIVNGVYGIKKIGLEREKKIRKQ